MKVYKYMHTPVIILQDGFRNYARLQGFSHSFFPGISFAVIYNANSIPEIDIYKQLFSRLNILSIW